MIDRRSSSISAPAESLSSGNGNGNGVGESKRDVDGTDASASTRPRPALLDGSGSLPHGVDPEPSVPPQGPREARDGELASLREGGSEAPAPRTEVDYSWGETQISSAEIQSAIEELEADLLSLIQDMASGPIGRVREDGRTFLGELRREFLRHHRRLTVQTRSGVEQRDLADLVHGELSELADRWRVVMLSRSAHEVRSTWRPGNLVEAVERSIAAVPTEIRALYEASSYEVKPSDGVWRRSCRSWLRLRRKIAGQGTEPMRDVPLQKLVNYHLSASLDEGLEAIAAALVRTDVHLAGCVQTLVAEVGRGYEGLLDTSSGVSFVEALALLREKVERELVLAERELQELAHEATRRTTAMLSAGTRALKAELGVFGTFELPASDRDIAYLAPARLRRLNEERCPSARIDYAPALGADRVNGESSRSCVAPS